LIGFRRRPISAAGPLKLIAINIVEKGQPLVQPVK
jgi:hypothetical protein